MAQVKPNVFIIGAPKCGTSSMAVYLSEHPHVCVSNPKEPTYFSTDLWQNTTSLDEYKKYFSHQEKQHKVICDATPIYLYSKDAIHNILNYQPDAKFIVMLRNPIDAAYALYYEWQNRGALNSVDFETLWRKGCTGSDELFNLCLWTCFGQQMQRLFDQVDQARVHVIIFEDMEKSPKEVYEKVLEFLNLPTDDRVNFVVHNKSKVSRSLMLAKFLHRMYELRRLLGIPKIGLGLFRVVENFNLVSSARPPLDLSFRKEMAAYYQSDIKMLSAILQRDLSHWLQVDLLKESKKISSQRKPTFFIVGSPKCGTTFLHEILSKHPNICMSSSKEPAYFAEDLDHHVMSVDDYLDFFSHANEKTVCIGEASTNYFRSKVAIEKIIAFQPKAKIIVMLRNPVEAIPSLFYEQQTSGLTLSRSFPADWKNKMMGGASYFEWFCFGEQLESLYKIVDKERVLVIIYDDLVRDSASVYHSVIEFLELYDDGQFDFKPRNTSKRPRSFFLSLFLYQINWISEKLDIPRLGTGLLSKLVSLNTESSERRPLALEKRQEIIKAYTADIMLLSDLLKRDFSNWLR